ncbi:unnamed protein product [Mesocestoides corti]|uniref:60S ribosomal export protein NMD3 n=1 Tax=Mesocestoides corti TaxID=53468 RepID=A0A0R3UJR5_MESCO|nr:unnamed protein product [Mesocestoides corti]
MCEACLASECDITADIPKQHTITFCPKCSRFLNPPSQWVLAPLESPELLSICLKRVKGLGKNNKLKEASFIYTEPHSRRLIIQVASTRVSSLTARLFLIFQIIIRGEICVNTVVEQKALLHFVMHPQQCSDCTRNEAKDYWNACVQIRQKVDHKRTLYYLEQLLLRKSAPRKYSSVKQAKGGMDFFFSSRANAVAFVEYVSKLIPCRTNTSQQLKSQDVHSNTYNYKYTFCLDVVPVCKNDVVCLTKHFASRLGFANQVLIVVKITDKVRLLDPVSCLTRDVDVQTYYANPFTAISNSRNVMEFFVMDVEADDCHTNERSVSSVDPSVGALKPAGAWVVPSAHLGAEGDEGEQVYVRTHLGNILKIGDSVIGLDLRNANVNHSDFEAIPEEKRPLVVLIQRMCNSTTRQRRHRRRLCSNGETFSEIAATSSVDMQSDAEKKHEYNSDLSDDEYVDAEEEVTIGEQMETDE